MAVNGDDSLRRQFITVRLGREPTHRQVPGHGGRANRGQAPGPGKYRSDSGRIFIEHETGTANRSEDVHHPRVTRLLILERAGRARLHPVPYGSNSLRGIVNVRCLRRGFMELLEVDGDYGDPMDKHQSP